MFQIKVSLIGVTPQIWRRLLVPRSISLDVLHDVLQTAMGWLGGHLHQFVTPDRTCFGIADAQDDYDGTKDETRFRVEQVLRRQKAWIVYEYDFGDGWEHKVVLEKILPSSDAIAVPTCIGGKRACPPEDCGGVPGYFDLLEAMRDRANPRHAELLDWLDEDFDPERFDIGAVNAVLAATTRRARPRR